MVIERNIVADYESWFLTPAGMYVDDTEKELLINTMRFKRGERTLNAGSGTGRYIEYLSDLGLEMTGLEPAHEMIKLARLKSKIKEEQIVQGVFEKMPFADNSFDNVIFINTFGYSQDKVKALSEAYRVAKHKVGIGFLNNRSMTYIFSPKERKVVFRDTSFFSGRGLMRIAEAALGEKIKECEIHIRYSLYLPFNIAHFVPFVDEWLERLNLPFGNFGVMLIEKK